ncbi:MAG: DegV family protein [Solobacterium sp.]|jgi:DegV family protein with EDD domain|nr:DegV family protein [Solobacterium sp.]
MWNIITDSSCDWLPEDTEDIHFAYIPFIMNIEGKQYLDTDDLDVDGMLRAMEASSEPCRTACPSPYDWYEEFKRPGNVFAITISKELSGSYNSACVARDMVLGEEPDKKIYVVNSIGTGPSLIIAYRIILNMIRKKASFEEIVDFFEKNIEQIRIIFALCSYDNLIKNGRMSRIAGFVASRLGFWGVGIGSPAGTIVIKTKVRGSKRVVQAILDDLKERGEPKEYVVISHAFNPEMAETIRAEVRRLWPFIETDVYQTKGLDSFYAEREGLILSYY